MEYILETHNLEKRYQNFKALNHLNIHIKKGAIYGLIGKNGAGKTTLMRVVCGLQKPTNGTYTIYGISNKNHQMNQVRKRMGAMIEAPSIYLDMTARENLIEQYKVVGLPSFDGLDEILKLVGLTGIEKKKAKTFSLGMKQRLGIAITLVGNPDFLILDEPINGLDPSGIIEIRELIVKLNTEKAITFLLSSHYLDELSKIATDYGFVNHGEIIKEITRKELEQNCQKRVEINVSNMKECVKCLEEMKITYEVISQTQVNIYDKVNISELAIKLSNRNCIINAFQEKQESLENYYINLMGGNENDSII